MTESEDQEIPEEVFHYTTMQTALEYILPSKELMLGQFGNTNDPKESKEWEYPIGLEFGDSRFDSSAEEFNRADFFEYFDKVHEEANRVRKNEWKVLCVTQHNLELEIGQDASPENPFMYGYARSRMWAQYSGNHTGVCLWLKGKEIDVVIRKQFGDYCKVVMGSIDYINEVPEYITDNIPIDFERDQDISIGVRKSFVKYYKEFFLRKSTDWETEHEFRWLVHNENDSPLYIPIESVLEGVIVGADFNEVYEPSLIELCKDLSVPVGRIYWKNGRPKVGLTSIYNPDNEN